MRSKFQGGEKVCMLAEGDIVECFENGTNEGARGKPKVVSPLPSVATFQSQDNRDNRLRIAGGILRMRIATPSNQVGWVSFTTVSIRQTTIAHRPLPVIGQGENAEMSRMN